MKKLAAIALLALLHGCGTFSYTPTEYPLRPGLIQPLTTTGGIEVSNGQPSKGGVVVYTYGPQQFTSTLYDITALMVQQTNGEIGKNFKIPDSASKKTIELKVDSLLSEYVFYSWKSEIRFTAKLGDGSIVDKSVKHASGSLIQDLNGCIAEGVMYLLNDPQVRAYLSR